MNSDNKSREINITHFDDIINSNDLNLDNVLIDEKSYENVLIYNVAYVVVARCRLQYGKYFLSLIFCNVFHKQHAITTLSLNAC